LSCAACNRSRLVSRVSRFLISPSVSFIAIGYYSNPLNHIFHLPPVEYSYTPCSGL
jgi:hypothetical protein